MVLEWSHFLRRTGFHPRIKSEGMLRRKKALMRREPTTRWRVGKRRFKTNRLAPAGSSDAQRGLSMEIKVFMLASLFSMIAALYHLSNWRAKADDLE
jgi:hypothetical protein